MAGPTFIPDDAAIIVQDAPSSGPDFISDAEFAAMQPQGLLTNSIKQGLAGGVEGVTGLVGFLADHNPFNMSSFVKPSNDASQVLAAIDQAVLPAPDPQYRYERTAGQFIGPGLLGGALGYGSKALSGAGPMSEFLTSQLALRPIVTNAGAAIGSQGAQDLFPESKVAAPILGALAGGGVTSLVADAGNAAASLLRPATEAEIKGSAALALKEATGLTPKEIGSAIIATPTDELSALRTTAELTGNAPIAQIEKQLGGAGQAAGEYASLDNARKSARLNLINAMSDVEGVNKEALGSELIGSAEKMRDALTTGEQALWDKVPRTVPVNIKQSQGMISDLLDSKQAGLFPKGDAKNLLGQFLEKKSGVMTSGALQDIRSDALSLLRDKNLSPIETRALSALSDQIDSSIKKGFKSGPAYDTYLQARGATAEKASIFARGTPGGSLVEPSARPSEVMARAFKGDSQSIQELRAAIGSDPVLWEKVKRGVIELIPTTAGGEITTNGIKKFLSANEGGIKQLFGEEHFGNFKRILEDMRSQDSVQALSNLASKGNSVTAQKQTVAGLLDDLMTESLLPGTGKLGSLANAVRKFLGVNNKEQIKNLLFRAAMEPSFALELSQAPTTTRVFKVIDRIANARDNLLGQSGYSTAVELGQKGLDAGNEDSRQSSTSQALQRTVQGEQGARGGQSSIFSNQSSLPLSAPTAKGSSQAVPQSQSGAKLQQSSYNSPPSIFSKDIPLASGKQAGNSSVFTKLSAAVEKVESGGKADAISDKGAVGLMQVTPIAAREVMRQKGIDDKQYTDAELRKLLLDPDTNKQIGDAYLTFLLDKYDGDVKLAVAAFNAGPTAVSKLLKGRASSYADIKDKLPAETRKYVPMVTSIFQKA